MAQRTKARRGAAKANALIKAVRAGDVEAVRKSLAAGADVNAIGPGLADGTIVGATPLMVAADQDQPRVAQVLIEAGADVNYQVPTASGRWRDYGYTALMIAAWRGHPEVVRVLLSAGAELELTASDPDAFHCRALHYAVRGRDVECVRLLVQAGADVDARSGDQRTPLQFARGARSRQLAEALLGAATGKSTGSEALFQAAESGNAPLLKSLLRDGANVNATDATGDTALRNAALYGHKNVVDLLLKAGADPNAGKKGSATALMHAAQNGWARTVKALLATGADANAVSREQETALDLADAYGNAECVRVLKRAGARTAAEVNPPIEKKIPPVMREDAVPMAPCPDLRDAAGTDAFAEAQRSVAKWTKSRPRETDVPGVVEFVVSRKRAAEVVRQRQDQLLKRGFYLVISRERFTDDEDWALWLVASDRWEHVVAAARMNGSNYDIGSRKIISQLRTIEKTNPFVLVVAQPDRLRARLLRNVKQAEQLAKRVAKLAPDVVSQGTETIERLVQIIKQQRQFWLWWA